MIEALVRPQGPLRAELEALAGEYPLAWHTDLNADGQRPGWFVARRAGRLVGVLTVFAPSLHEGEVQAWVAPDHRRSGVFMALWAGARRAWDQPGFRWLWVADGQWPEGRAVASSHGTLSHAERTLARPVGFLAPMPPPERLESNDADALTAVLARANGTEPAEFSPFVARVLADLGRRFWGTRVGSELVAVVGTHRENDQVGLFGLAVDPAFQRRGFARDLVQCVLSVEAPGAARFVLDVDSSNAKAEALYRSLGFDDAVVTEYWEVV